MRRFLRVPANWISIIFFPLIQLLVFSQLYQDITQLPGFGGQASYLAYLAPGQIAFTAFMAVNWAGYGMLLEYRGGYLDKLRASPVVKLDGDHDVFGDGSVVIVSTPGHTPGHQSLLVRLPKTGAVLLSGDMVHFESNWTNRRVPARNFDRDQSLRTMERVAAFLDANKAKLWINHDKAQSAGIPHAPEFVQ